MGPKFIAKGLEIEIFKTIAIAKEISLVLWRFSALINSELTARL